MKIADYEWYDPISNEANKLRSLTYYVGFELDLVLELDFEVNCVIDCLNHYPVGCNKFYIIRKNNDYTETTLFEWNHKHKLWFNVYNHQRKLFNP